MIFYLHYNDYNYKVCLKQNALFQCTKAVARTSLNTR